MKRFTMFACLALTLVFAMNVFASDSNELPQRVKGDYGVFYGSSSDLSKAAKDTVILIGPGYPAKEQVNGTFQDAGGAPAWNGWTTRDITQPTVTHWHTSPYFADNLGGGAGNLALYCGIETIISCGFGDPVGGYGASWNDIIEYVYTVPDNGIGCNVAINGELNADSEPGYDTTFLVFETTAGLLTAQSWDTLVDNDLFSANLDYVATDYIGPNADQVRVAFYFQSDGGWDDGDCSFPSHGAVQIDDMTVVCSNGADTYGPEDFESGLGLWVPAFPTGVGNFSQLWTGLEDVDPCRVNYTPQVAFIDDGVIVPGVGPSTGISWLYGPLTYVVNSTGGATFSNANKLHIAVESPIVNWPGPTYVGANLTFNVYAHEGLGPSDPGMMYEYNIKSAADPANLAGSGWIGDGFVRYGGPAYLRPSFDVSTFLETGLTVARAQLGVYELGWAWGADGDDGTPAPYFDNVRFIAYEKTGPSMVAREIDLAQDAFPASGAIDIIDLSTNSVRFDMAQNIDLASQLTNTPGDSLVLKVTSNRVGATLALPVMHYTINQNPVFDPYRVGFTAVGTVTGYHAVNNAGAIVPDIYAFDLPDEYFLFPGDVMHYYFEATDDDGSTTETSYMPGNRDGYGDFSSPLAYNTSFVLNCLPTITDAAGDQPSILFWNDFGGRGGENEWYGALNNIGLLKGVHYDVYYTNGPSSNVGNGLGGRANSDQIAGYTTLLYTAGDLERGTIANGDPYDAISDDANVLDLWFAGTTDVKAFMTGDELVFDLNRSGPVTTRLRQDKFGVSLFSKDLMPNIGDQTTPLVLMESGNSVFTNTTSWVAYGGCLGINTFDAVELLSGAERLARFTDSNGAPAYTYSAATKNVNEGDTVISLPYDFMFVYTNPDDPLTLGADPVASRVVMLEEILGSFGHTSTGRVPSDTPGAEKFFAKNYPNPFNPTTKIEFNMPKAGHLSLKVYNVRGELVKTLIDEAQAQGAGHIMWDGTNDQGSNVSSGVYFYEARTAGEVQVNKMALVK